MALYKIDKVTTNRDTFAKRVTEIAAELMVPPEWIMGIMWFESKLNPQAVNKQPGDSDDPLQRLAKRATGLIQFMPTTAKGLGTTNLALYNMNNLQQLEYVRKYFLPYKGKIKTPEDLYLVVFYPAAVGKPGTYQLPQAVQDQNQVFQSMWVNGKLLKDSITKYYLAALPDLKKK